MTATKTFTYEALDTSNKVVKGKIDSESAENVAHSLRDQRMTVLDISEEGTGDYADKYDAALIFANVKGFAQEAAIRIKWSTPMAAEIPWYATEVPTVFVSLTQPNHLIDVPMVRTAINAHADTREAIRATVQKIIGRSEFQGTFNDNVFCDSFDTRL